LSRFAASLRFRTRATDGCDGSAAFGSVWRNSAMRRARSATVIVGSAFIPDRMISNVVGNMTAPRFETSRSRRKKNLKNLSPAFFSCVGCEAYQKTGECQRILIKFIANQRLRWSKTPLFTSREFAKKIDCAVETVYRGIKRGHIKVLKIGGLLRIPANQFAVL
jgi:hypothetical protein